MLTHKRWLVLGAECMQLRVGARIGWEVPYQQIDQIALFRWLFGWPCLGVRLRVTEDFDRAWPHLAKRRVWSLGRRGFDLALRLDAASEPPERILETALACLHRFRAQDAALACDSSSGDLPSNQADPSDFHPDGAFRETHPDRR